MQPIQELTEDELFVKLDFSEKNMFFTVEQLQRGFFCKREATVRACSTQSMSKCTEIFRAPLPDKEIRLETERVTSFSILANNNIMYTDGDFFVSQRGFTLLGKMACFRFGEVFSLVGLLLLPVVHGFIAEVRAKATQGVFSIHE